MKTFLTAEWRHLLMINYAVDPALLAPYVPDGTSLDSFDGVAYASLVGFRFVNTRVLGVHVPAHRDFEELNLRVYVRRIVGGEHRRGVVFIREIVPRRAVAWLARAVYNEPYIAAPMRSTVLTDGPVRVEYAWRLGGRWHRCGGIAAGAFTPSRPGSLEEFITEHYWGYTRQRDGSTIEYRVEHPRWNVTSVHDAAVDADLSLVYGPELAASLASPVSAFLADGSAVTVMRPVRL